MTFRRMFVLVLLLCSSARVWADDSCAADSAAACSSSENLAVKSRVMVAVRSQDGRPHAMRVAGMRAAWGYAQDNSSLIPLHTIGGIATWPLFPVFPALVEKLSPAVEWVLFVEDDTDIRWKELGELLSQYDPTGRLFLGRALYDTQGRTIIHHFREDETFAYPDFACGFVMSTPLLRLAAATFTKEGANNVEFTIDPQYELARFLESTARLRNNGGFCARPGHGCGTVAHGRPAVPPFSDITVENILFAVKTASIFHTTRLAHVRATWARQTAHIDYISDVADSVIPTLASGIPNTESV
jgi:hypothetical protein